MITNSGFDETKFVTYASGEGDNTKVNQVLVTSFRVHVLKLRRHLTILPCVNKIDQRSA